MKRAQRPRAQKASSNVRADQLLELFASERELDVNLTDDATEDPLDLFNAEGSVDAGWLINDTRADTVAMRQAQRSPAFDSVFPVSGAHEPPLEEPPAAYRAVRTLLVVILLASGGAMSIYAIWQWPVGTMTDVPEIPGPEVSTPEVQTAQVSTSRVSRPEVSTPERSTSEIPPSEVSTPEASVPEMVAPQRRLPSADERATRDVPRAPPVNVRESRGRAVATGLDASPRSAVPARSNPSVPPRPDATAPPRSGTDDVADTDRNVPAAPIEKARLGSSPLPPPVAPAAVVAAPIISPSIAPSPTASSTPTRVPADASAAESNPARVPREPVAAPTAVTVADSGAIHAVLSRYQTAFNILDTNMASQVWPTVDARTLDRAFKRLQQQELSFDSCQIAVNGTRAVASCAGQTRYVPKVGSRSSRTEKREWKFDLHKVNRDWVIQAVDTR